MADNIEVTAGSGSTVAADDIGGVLHQRVKISQGADGSATDVSSAAPLQVTLANTGANATPVVVDLGANNDVTVTGTVDLGATDNAVLDTIAAKDFATQTTLAAINTKLASGTVIGDVNLGATDNAVLDDIAADTEAIKTAVEILDNVVSGSEAQVDIVSSALPTGASTLAEQQTQTTHLATIAGDTTAIETAVQIVDDWDNGASDGASVSGDVAHDAADAGEPVKIGYKAIAHGTNPTAVAANDRTNGYANRAGVPFVIGGHPNPVTASINVTDADGAQTNAAIISASAGTKIVVTWISVTADNANTGDVQVRVGFGTANTPAADAAKLIIDHPGVASGGGMVLGNGGGILGVGADDEDLRITCEDPAGGSISVVVGYYTIES